MFGIRSEIKGNQIDFKTCWTVNKIYDRNRFLARLIELVPDNSIWTIEGLSDKDIYNLIAKHIVIDDTKIWRGSIWPKHDLYKIKLSEKAKKDLLKGLSKWDLVRNIEHQHIYKGDKFYMTSYDNLHESSTWLSKDFDIKEITTLKDQGVIDFYDSKQKEIK